MTLARSPSTIIITACQASLLGSLIWAVLLRQSNFDHVKLKKAIFVYFHDIADLFFQLSYSREKCLKISDIFPDKMEAEKSSDNAKSISIAE